ncbi:MAG: efflux RND transporter periplasmic adaptor subunit [Deltaproteobacteria bacterium]|nr:efflux RND transporter periplasmic adaptor subunit [Deltaproteobacteria bacterium]
MRVRADLAAALRVATASRSTVQARLQGFGRVAFAAGASYAVRVPAAAFVERVHVAVGDSVAAGAALATLRSPEVARLRGEAARLEAQLVGDRDAARRIEALIGQGAASERELIEVRARLAAAQAEQRGVRGQIAAWGAGAGTADRFVLRASAAGQVLLRTIDPGERVGPEDAEPALLIGDPNAVVIRASFAERDATLLTEGSACVFTVPSLGADRFEGTVSQVVRVIDAQTRNALAVCRPRAVDPRLRAEMVTRVEVEARGAAVLSVPRGALLLRRDDRVVFVRGLDGTLERRVVESGATVGESVQILSGLSEGEVVVSENAVLLDGELDAVL